MTDIEKRIMDRRPIFCKKCSGKLFYQAAGNYKCKDCGEEEYDDFGKIKNYLESNGPSPATVIAEGTGVPLEIINIFLKNGRLEIPEGSKFYIKCERCGCSLRYGRYCPGCTRELAGQLHGAMFEQMGEKPKYESKKNKEKMHFLDHVDKKGRK